MRTSPTMFLSDSSITAWGLTAPNPSEYGFEYRVVSAPFPVFSKAPVMARVMAQSSVTIIHRVGLAEAKRKCCCVLY